MVKKFFKVFFFTASLTFAACSNITSAPDEQRESTTQTTCATLSGRLIVNGALPSASSGTQSARTAFPTVPESFTYRVTAKKGSETVTGTVDTSDPDDITYSISFPSSGNWTVTAEALSHCLSIKHIRRSPVVRRCRNDRNRGPLRSAVLRFVFLLFQCPAP